MTHTPTPWRVEADTTLIWGDCNPDDNSTRGMGYPIVECRINPSGNWSTGPYADEGEANASFIVRAVNSHDRLVYALRRARQCTEELCHGQDPDNECWAVLASVDAALEGME